jgi:hypothetical protein
MPTKVLMTFDLKDAESDDYQPGYDALVEQGLSRVSAQKKLRLPYSSVMGDVPDTLGKSAREICNNLTRVLAEATKKDVERVVVAVVSDWACSGKNANDLWLEELLARYESAILRLSR